MTRTRRSLFSFAVLAVFCGLLFSDSMAYGQNRVSFSLQNRQIVSGVYQAELWATMPAGMTWNVGNCLINIGFNHAGLSIGAYDNAAVLNADPALNGGSYFAMTQSTYGNGLSVNIINFSGSFASKTGSFRIGTLRWEILNGFQPDSVRVATDGADASVIMHSWETLSFSGGDSTCYAIVTPTPQQIGNPPVITQQPQSASTCAGNDAMFAVAATGTDLTYQWQKQTSGGWQNIAGATGTQLVLPAVTAADTVAYRVVMTGDSPPVVTSNNVTLTVLTSPAIISQPTAATVCEDNDAFFTVACSGTPTPTVIWEMSSDGGVTWIPLQDASVSTLILAAATSQMSGWQVRAVGTNSCGMVISQPAQLTVQNAPSITTQPVNMVATAGDTVTLQVGAAGSDLTYQWQKNGVDIAGATASSLVLNNVQESDIATYRVVVGGACSSSITSGNAVLFVQPADTTITIVTVKALMQGYWNGTSHVRTPVSVELRSGATLATSTITAIDAGILGTDGTVSLQFNGLAGGQYWIVVRHGGYLPVASNGRVQINTGGTTNYDFSDAAAKSWMAGTIAVPIGGTTYYVFKAGDLNGDRAANPQDIQHLLQGFPKTNAIGVPGL